MNSRDLVLQLHAVKEIGPVPRYSTIHMRLAENPMMIAFVRMAGESRPWAISYGRFLDEEPKILSVPDGRNRNTVAEMCEKLAEEFLEYFRVTGYTWDPITKNSTIQEELPQLWVPSARHVEMFHHLEYAFWRVRKGDDRTKPLTVFARLTGWLFRESTRMGQQTVVDASKLFRDSYVFPTDNTSLGHLGSCLEWFNPHQDIRSARLAVREVATLRDSPTLDPELDNKIFSPLINRRIELIEQGKSTQSIDTKIDSHLASEVIRRWELIQSAYRIFSNDTRSMNPGVEDLTKSSLDSFYSSFQRIEENLQDPDLGPAYTPHPETDFHGSAAASSYFVMNAADTAYIAKLVHFDKELQAQSLAAGQAFFSEVVNVHNIGVGRLTTPQWILRVEIGEKLRIREGERYSPLGAPLHGILVRSIKVLNSQSLEIIVEWTDRKTMALEEPLNAKPVDTNWIGHRIMFVPKDGSDFDKSKSWSVWKASAGPGAWLTHGSAPVKIEPSIIDDVTQLTGAD